MSLIHPKAATSSLAVCVVACLLTLPIKADDQEKRDPYLKSWGQVINPDHDCDLTLTDGSISMKVPGVAHDFAAELKLQNSPRVVTKLTGDFIAEVKVSGEFKPGATSTIQGRRAYHGAGLLVIQDKDNYISLHRGCVFLDDRLRHYANFELRKDGELTISNYEIEIPDQDTYLRLERRGDRVLNATSPDGIHWTSYDPITLKMPKSVEFGIVGVSSSNVPLSIRFQDLTIFRKAEVE